VFIIHSERETSLRRSPEIAISREIYLFLQHHAEQLLSFDHAIVYYDNGQEEITSILNESLERFFFSVEYRKGRPAEYRLFQVADLFCTLEL
jgi:hypothetical protein